MAMTVQVDQATGATPTWTTNVTAVVWNRSDDNTTTNGIPTPTVPGIVFSYVKTLRIYIPRTPSRVAGVKLLKVVDIHDGQAIWSPSLCSRYTQPTRLGSCPDHQSDRPYDAEVIRKPNGRS